MFVLIVCSIWALVLAHVFFRAQSLFGLRGKIRSLVGVGGFILGFGYIPVIVLIRLNETVGMMAVPALATAFFIGLVSIAWTLVVLMDCLSLLIWLATRRRMKNASPKVRRMTGTAWVGASLLLSWMAVNSALETPPATRLKVSIPGVQQARLAIISDTHLGAISSADQWRRTLEAAAKEEPHALLIAGDLIDDSTDRAEKQVAMIREVFPDEPVYMVAGNHEQYIGLDFLEYLCQRYHFRLLRQESEVLVPGLTVAGIDYCFGKKARSAVEKAVNGVEGALLLLAHRPEAALHLQERSRTLVLAGHTHAGQVPPMTFLAAFGNNGFKSGYYAVGQASLYVSRGAGVWGPPMRLLAPSEIVVLDLRDGQEFAFSP